MQKIGLLMLVVGLVTVSGARAQEKQLDAASQEALRQTIQLLNSPAQRDTVINKDPNAKKADDRVQSLMGTPENTAKLYELAGKIMENLANQAAGDPEKMMEILEKAQRDPASFAASFTPEQQKMLQELAKQVEKTGTMKKKMP